MKSQIKKLGALFLSVCIALTVMAVLPFAAAESTTEITLTVDSLGLASQSYSAGTKTVDGAAFEWIQLGNYGNGIQVRDKNGNTSQLWNTAAFSAPIKEIKLVYSDSMDVTYSNANMSIFSFGNAADNLTNTVKLSTVAGTKTYTITPDAETYTYFKYEHDLGYTSYWKSITIVLVDDTTSTPTTSTPVTSTPVTSTPTTSTPSTPVASEIVLTVDSLGLASQSYSAGTKTVGGAAFEWIQLGNYGNGIQVRDKNGNTSQLWNTAAFSAPIKKIELVYSDTMSVDHSNADMSIFSFGNAADNLTNTVKLSTVAGTKTYTITPDAETYTYFKYEHDLGYTSYWKSITIVLADGTTSTPTTSTPTTSTPTTSTPTTGTPSTEKTFTDAVAEAKALTSNSTLPYKVTATGVIESIDTPYDSGYKNITVTIKVGNESIKCYRLSAEESKLADVANLAIGDTITVNGAIAKYNSTVQFAQGTMMTNVVKGGGSAPIAPENPKQIVDEAFALESGKTLPYNATLTGVVTEITEAYSEQFGNITLNIEVEGTAGKKEILCYRMKGTDIDVVKVGDTIKVSGNIKNYSGTIEFTPATLVEILPDDDDDTSSTPTTSTPTTSTPAGDEDDDTSSTTSTPAGAGDEDEDNTQGGNAGNDGAAGSGDGSDDNIDAPNTGDNATVYVLLALIAIAGVALIVTKKVRA